MYKNAFSKEGSERDIFVFVLQFCSLVLMHKWLQLKMALASYGSTGENKRRAEVRTPVPLKIIDKVHYV